MSYKVQCSNHKKITYTIPQSVNEAVTLDSFSQIREMANHLKHSPKCRMIRSLDFD